MSSIHSIHINGSNLFGGAERFMLRLVNALNESDHTASIALRPKSPMLNEIFKTTTVNTFPMANKWDLISVALIKKHLHKAKPKIVQTYMGRATRLTRVPKSLNIPHIARLGGYYKIDGYYRHADAWVGNTKGLCDYLIKQGLHHNRVFHISNFVDFNTQPSDVNHIERMKAKLGIPENSFVIFALGRLVKVKGFDVLINALSQLPKEIMDRPVHLVIAGTGDIEDALKNQSKEQNLEDRTHFVGWQPNASGFFRMCDLFVCPSNQETLGNVILEAWAHKKPVLSTATAGGTELIEPEFNGLITPIGDSQAMAKKINDVLILNETEKDALGNNGFQALEKGYSKDKILSEYNELYSQLIHQHAL